MGMSAVQVALPVVLFVTVVLFKFCQWRKLTASSQMPEQITVSKYPTQYAYGDEIVHNGVLYDIKMVREVGGNYIISAIADKQEMRLGQICGYLFGSGGHTDTEQVKILPFVFLFFETPWLWLPGKIITELDRPVYSSPFFPYRRALVISPPPRRNYTA